MSKPLFRVLNQGVYSSIQDLGRYGYQQAGVPVSGAMDKLALQIGNILVGNDRGEAALEITMGLTSLEVLGNHIIIITGADLDCTLDDSPVPIWKTIRVRKGQTLSFRGPRGGLRSYVCVAGGFDSPIMLGSKSVYERGKLGKSIEKDNILYVKDDTKKSPSGVGISNPPFYSKQVTVRLVTSHHLPKFSSSSMKIFFQTSYKVRAGDRMGLQIKGEIPLQFVGRADIISEGVTFGTIQVPTNGDPIILMADSQTTGGYATVGNIIQADLWKVAQLPPGGKISFQMVTHDHGLQSLRDQERYLKLLSLEYHGN